MIAHERYEDLLAKRGVLAEQFVDYVTRAVLRRDASGRPVVSRETEEITTGLGTSPTATVTRPVDDAGPATSPPELVTAETGGGEVAPRPTMASADDQLAVSGTEAVLVEAVLAPTRVLRVPRVRVKPRAVTFRLTTCTATSRSGLSASACEPTRRPSSAGCCLERESSQTHGPV